jgi:hypothetical protein
MTGRQRVSGRAGTRRYFLDELPSLLAVRVKMANIRDGDRGSLITQSA